MMHRGEGGGLIGNDQAPVHKSRKHLLGILEKGELDPLQTVSHRVALGDLNKVCYKFDAKEDAMQKVFVKTEVSLPKAPAFPDLTRYLL